MKWRCQWLLCIAALSVPLFNLASIIRMLIVCYDWIIHDMLETYAHVSREMHDQAQQQSDNARLSNAGFH